MKRIVERFVYVSVVGFCSVGGFLFGFASGVLGLLKTIAVFGLGIIDSNVILLHVLWSNASFFLHTTI